MVRPHQPGMRTHFHIRHTHWRFIAYKVMLCRKTQPTNHQDTVAMLLYMLILAETGMHAVL